MTFGDGRKNEGKKIVWGLVLHFYGEWGAREQRGFRKTVISAFDDGLYLRDLVS